MPPDRQPIGVIHRMVVRIFPDYGPSHFTIRCTG
jgi:hypothetical protein